MLIAVVSNLTEGFHKLFIHKVYFHEKQKRLAWI